MKLGQVVQVQNLLGPLCNCEKTVKKRPEKTRRGTIFVCVILNFLREGIFNYPPTKPPKSSLGGFFQLSLPKYAKQNIFTSKHVS